MLNVERIPLASEDGLLALLAGVIDPRKPRGVRHPLLTVLAISVCGILSTLVCSGVARPSLAATRDCRPGQLQLRASTTTMTQPCLFMPLCGQMQQYTVADVILALGPWVRALA